MLLNNDINYSVSRRPDLNFTIIVNPNSGPGDAALPDPRYVSAVQRLNSYPNIETIGYVRTGYASRNLSDVTHEVGVYSGWSANSSSLAMHGIFFDEAPHEYSAEAVEFLRAADKFAKNAPGLLGRKTVSTCVFTLAKYQQVKLAAFINFRLTAGAGCSQSWRCPRLSF